MSTHGQGWASVELSEVPVASGLAPDEARLLLIQHFLRLSAFGVNALVGEADQMLVEEHDESKGGQEELYLVLAGRIRFAIGESHLSGGPGMMVAIRDPAVTRAAVALEAGSTLLAIGAAPGQPFKSTWWQEHFTDVPQVEP